MPSLGPGRGRVRRAIDEPCVAYAASALPRDRRRCRRKEPRQAAPSWPMGRKEREGMERRGGMEPRARPGRAPRGLAPLDEDGRSQELSLGVSAPLEGKRAAPSSRLPAPGSQLPAPSSQLPAPGSQLPAPSSQLAAPSSQLPAPSSRVAAPCQEVSPRFRATARQRRAEPPCGPGPPPPPDLTRNNARRSPSPAWRCPPARTPGAQ